MKTCIVETINKITKEPIRENKDKIEVAALAPLSDVTLSEAGFSEPVGIFDPIKRIAYLTSSLDNRSLIIEVSNVLLLCNSFTVSKLNYDIAVQIAAEVKNLVIKDLIVDSVGTSIFIEGESENIKIQNCKFLGFGYGVGMSNSRKILIEKCIFENLFGISLNVTSCVKIIDNQFINNLTAVNLFDSAQKTLIAENTFFNCSEGIMFFENNTRNTIVDNEFIVEKAMMNTAAIWLVSNNAFNFIKNNIMVLENIDYTITGDSFNLNIYFIYVEGEENNLNKFIKNEFRVRKNLFNLTSTIDMEIRIYGVGFYYPNTRNEFKSNKFETIDNSFNMIGGTSQILILEGILERESLNNKIVNNICEISSNRINYDSINTTIYTENIFVGTDDKGTAVLDNKISISKNTISSSSSLIAPIYFANSIVLYSGGIGNIVCNNEIELNGNTNIGELIAIRLEDACACNEVINNKMKNIEGDGILINTGGVDNIIKKNIIENISKIGIVIVSDNFSNIIKDNIIVGIFIGIYVGFDNTSNVIDNNYIKNNKYGIYFALDGNTSNTIKNNKLCNNLVTLIGIDPIENYLCNNIIECCEV